MLNSIKSVPMQTFKRLPDYYNLLVKLNAQGTQNVSSTTIAGILDINDVVVRKDLALVGKNGGKPRTGYVVCDLMKCIGTCLGYYNAYDAVLVGAGQLGRALLSYNGFAQYGVNIVAAFDVDNAIIGMKKNGKPVMPISELSGFCRRLNIHIGIITVPECAAQEVCELLLSCGVTAIWNFAPTHLTVPDNVFVHSENMALSLSLLSQHLTKKDGSQPM